MLSQLLKPLIRRRTTNERLDQLAWEAVKMNPNNLIAYLNWKKKQLRGRRAIRIWMNGKTFYQTPRGYLIPEETWLLNREKFEKLIEEGRL